MPKNIYAFLVGINEYQDPDNNLNGCVNDVESMKEYLETFFNNEKHRFHSKVLIDKEATRENLIKGFEYFQKAKNGDICLFQYSGHGARCLAPKAFGEKKKGKLYETLVCYDSRSPGGRDLLDKELSYLIWKATKNKQLHFVVLMDCCHSGANTRGEYRRPRYYINNQRQEFMIEDFLGFRYYKKSKNNQYTPPRGPHILLSACRDKETAMEVYINGIPRGIFTYCIIDALKGANNQISYIELINRVTLRIKNKVSFQSPQLKTTQSKDKNLFFLSATATEKELTYLIAYDNDIKSWCVNAGALHGIMPSNETSQVTLTSIDGMYDFFVKEAFAQYATVSTARKLDEYKSYKVRINRTAVSSFTIAFAEDNEEKGEKIIRRLLKEQATKILQIVEHPINASYIIHAKNEAYYFTRLGEGDRSKKEKPTVLLKKIKGFSSRSAKMFVQNLELVGRWIQLLELNNPNTSIRDEELSIELFRSLTPGEEHNDTAMEKVDWRSPNIYRYEKQKSSWNRPAFQLKVKNTGARILWISLLYFGDNYSIDNILIDKKELCPGEEVYASYIKNGYTQHTIPIMMEDHYHHQGIYKIQEYLKLFICTEEFGTDNFNQCGLKFEEFSSQPLRKMAIYEKVNQEDWATKEIILEIHRPKGNKFFSKKI